MSTPAETFAEAKALHRAGKLPEALRLYQQVLQAESANAEAHYLLGVAFHGLGSADDAITSLAQATRLQPDHAEAHNYLGAVLAQLGNLDGAISSFQQALLLRPDSSETSSNLRNALAAKDNNRANALAAQGNLDEAVAVYQRALTLNPDFVESHNNLGAALASQNKLDEAVACFRRALELKADYFKAHHNLGSVLARQAKLDEAAVCFRRALELRPDDLDACYNLANLAVKQNKLEEAAAWYRRVLELKPASAEAHDQLGVVLGMQEKLDEAAACYRRALELKGDFAEAHNHLGGVLEEQGQFEAAVACWQRALELKPNFSEASLNLGVVLAQQGRNAEAETCYRNAMQVDTTQGIWRLSILSLCPTVFGSSEEIDLYRAGLLSELEDFSNTQPAFELSALVRSDCMPSFNLQYHGRNDRPIRQAYARLFRHCFPTTHMPTGSSGRPRIGFVVTDRHETGFLNCMRGVLEHINTDLLEPIVIGSDCGIAAMRLAIQNQAVRLLGIPNNFAQIATAIRDARLDLLYYWEVATDSTNYFLPFLRLAPVQCTSWGIQVTSGIPQLDHYISSELVEPPDANSQYTEHLVLARTLLTYRQRASVGDAPKPRASFGIAPDRHWYLCAQQLRKFHPDFDAILAGILRQDAEGVVVIADDRQGGFIANQLRRRFAATIPDVAGRIVFLPRQPHPDYLSLVAAADVLLDPVHYGGVNSSYDGFSLNQPIVTLPSQFQRGRYTLGCYKKMGVSDCVASDPQHYIEIAVALGTDAKLRTEVVDKIRRASSVLFEDLEAVREHERIFSALIENARPA